MSQWCEISRPYLVPVPNYWTSTNTTPKKWFFWSNPYKVEVMITSLIEMLKLPKIGNMTTSTILFESCEKILLVTSHTEVMTSSPLFQNIFISRRPRVANFADIIKNSTMFTETTSEDSKKFIRSRIYALKCNLYLYFLIY